MAFGIWESAGCGDGTVVNNFNCLIWFLLGISETSIIFLTVSFPLTAVGNRTFSTVRVPLLVVLNNEIENDRHQLQGQGRKGWGSVTREREIIQSMNESSFPSPFLIAIPIDCGILCCYWDETTPGEGTLCMPIYLPTSNEMVKHAGSRRPTIGGNKYGRRFLFGDKRKGVDIWMMNSYLQLDVSGCNKSLICTQCNHSS